MVITAEEKINAMYDAKKSSRLKELEDAYRENVQAENQRADNFPGTYQAKANALAAEYEKQKRSFNEAAAANGINTGAASQAALSRQSAYEQGMAGLRQAEAEAAANSADSLAKLETNYKSAVASAIAENDYQRAEALYSVWKDQGKAEESKAQLLAQYGDFSGYAAIYGDGTAAEMESLWIAKNPDLAYKTGKITVEVYKKLKKK